MTVPKLISLMKRANSQVNGWANERKGGKAEMAPFPFQISRLLRHWNICVGWCFVKRKEDQKLTKMAFLFTTLFCSL